MKSKMNLLIRFLCFVFLIPVFTQACANSKSSSEEKMTLFA